MLITLKDLSFKYLDQPILSNINLTINEKDKIGVLGHNGAGKTTLLKLIEGSIKPDSGNIFYSTNFTIGYLKQTTDLQKGSTIIEEVIRLSGVKEDYEAKAILNKLGLPIHNKVVDNLSGGEKKRLILASVLIKKCDLLILDEPTNHLDIMMIAWLEKYLQRYSKAIILVTHDRYFLQRVTTKIIDIENANIYVYEAKYSEFLKLKAERLESLAASNRKLEAILKKETKWILQGAQARSTKSKDRLDRFNQLEEQTKINHQCLKEQEQKIAMDSQHTRIGKKTIIFENVSKEIEQKILFKDFNYILRRYDRLGIIGGNGTGKTTFFNIIAGLTNPTNGHISYGETIKIGYFKQHIDMDESLKVIEYLKSFGEYLKTPSGNQSALALLENYQFSLDQIHMPINRLSGGEKRRLQLLTVLISNPNVLLLDEPTNDLDIYTLEILEDYLENFIGAVIAISHDRYFLDKVCDHLLIFNEDSICHINESASEYMQCFKQSDNKKEQKIQTKVLKFKASEQKEYEKIEQDIMELEDKIKNIDLNIFNSDSDYEALIKLTEEKDYLNQQLMEKYYRWEYLDNLKEQINLFRGGKKNE